MAKYIVSYNVTVDVVVDLEEGTIDKVVINDDCMGDPCAYFQAEDNLDNWHEIVGVGGEAVMKTLTDIVDGTEAETTEWPTWSHGW